ncbi:MAG: 16S rRNA (cytosine(1402)-N(4))-methyltransferase RsmH, partial [Gemmatimonadales bacterium]
GGGKAPSPEYHVPVLTAAVAAWATGGQRAVDATAGGGGHTAVLRAAGARVLAIDRDPAAIAATRARLHGAGAIDGVSYLTAPFGSGQALAAIAAFRPDRVLLDLGLSSHQVDSADRGFTFRPGAPLDMRMTPDARASAADILNEWPEAALAACFADFADEPPGRSRRLARVIAKRRGRAPFATSDDLVNAIRETLGARAGPSEFARLFQAVRIAVNDERGELERALPALLAALAPAGRLAVIAYHSGEDRIVKHTFREWSRSCVCPPRQPICTCRGRALGRLLTPRAVTPPPAEVGANPRSRSAKFRSFEKEDAVAGDA